MYSKKATVKTGVMSRVDSGWGCRVEGGFHVSTSPGKDDSIFDDITLEFG